MAGFDGQRKYRNCSRRTGVRGEISPLKILESQTSSAGGCHGSEVNSKKTLNYRNLEIRLLGVSE